MKELFGIIRTQIKVLLRKPSIVLTGRKLLKAATQINKLVYKKHLKRNSSETQILFLKFSFKIGYKNTIENFQINYQTIHLKAVATEVFQKTF